MDSLVAAGRPATVIRSQRFFLASLTAAAFFVGASEFMLSSMLGSIAAAFGASPADASWLVSSYALSYALAAPAFGYVSDRIDRVRLLRFALLFFMAADVGVALVPSLPMAIALRIFGGMASAVLIPTSFALIAEAFRRDRQAGAMGVVMLGMAFGIAFGPALAGVLTDQVSWQAPFLVTSGGCAGAFLVSLFGMSSCSASAVVRGCSSAKWFGKWHVLRPLVARGVWNGTGVSAFLISGEILRYRYGFGASEIGGTITVFGVGLATGNVSVGWLRRRCGREEISLVLLALFLFGAVGTFVLVDLPLIGSFLCLISWGAALGACAPLSTVVLAERSGPDKGAVLAFAETLDNVIILVTVPLAAGILTTAGTAPTMAVLSVGLAFGLVLAIWDAVATAKQ